jgi:steroid 5-alpha reductase family enzyme
VSLISTLVILAVLLSFAMAAAWLIAERSGNHGWVDTIWSFATGIAGAMVALMPVSDAAWAPRQVLVAVLVALWALRLGGYILKRTMQGHDDPRYAALRKEWGKSAGLRLFIFLQIQAVAAFALVLAAMVAAHHPSPNWRIGDGFGLALFLIAVAGEALADRQLARFRADPANRGRVCDRGLWGVTRHPNYFFEWLGWLAYPVIAIDLTGDYPWGFAAIAAPVLIYFLLVHASGIPPTEAHMLRTRGEAFRAYQRRVNAFWPGLPGRQGS